MIGAAAIVAAVVAVGASCARRQRPAASPTPPGSPVVRGADSGLELWWWVVTDRREASDPAPTAEAKPGEAVQKPVFTVTEPGKSLEEALLPYVGRATPFPEEMRELWRAHGLRIVCVPVAELDGLQRSMRLTGPVHRQWFGHMPEWTDVVRGPQSSSRVIMVGDKPEELRPGRLRLMSRCWVYPVAGAAGAPAAGLRLELVPQFEGASTERSRLQIAQGLRERTDLVDFPSLLAGVSIERLQGEPDAILIVPEKPEVDWLKPAESETGPEVEMPPSLGEAMLATGAVRTERGATSRSRAVVILIPRLPERFELLGR